MHQSFSIACGLLLSLQLATAADKGPPPAQAQRGRELFTKSPKGTACGQCHSMAGLGRAVGPDLTTLASTVGPKGLTMTFKMTVYAYVKDYNLAQEVFPGIEKRRLIDDLEIWDLSQHPPALRKLAAKQILSARQTRTWKHPPASAGYTPQEFADLIGFLKWAATGATTEIKPSDIEGQ